MEKQLVTVVIPVHLEEPSELEKISLEQTVSILGRYTITFMAPYELDTTWYEGFCYGRVKIKIERFDWAGHEAYSMLQSSALFYRRFLSYQYVLTCHMDAFVFRDELEYWCGLGFDYIGSVIYNPDFKLESTSLRKLTGFTNPEYFGNGGFGLKKVSSCYDITSRYKLYIALYHLVRKLRRNNFYEDLFITQHFRKLSSKFSISPKIFAQKFGAAYELGLPDQLPFNNKANDDLPFGIHGWIQHHRDFWRPCIRRCGFDI